jgi:hypothetical protein
MADGRMIGPVGTAARVAVGAGLLVLAAFGPWPVTWWGALLGLVGLPAVLVGAQALRARAAARRARASGRGHPAVLVAAAALAGLGIAAPAGVMLTFGGAMLLGALRGTGGCEVTAFGNWALGRADVLFCPLFSPIDRLEGALRARRHG